MFIHSWSCLSGLKLLLFKVAWLQSIVSCMDPTATNTAEEDCHGPRKARSKVLGAYKSAQIVGLEMVLFPPGGGFGTNCTKLCETWKNRLLDFLETPRKGEGFQRHPLYFPPSEHIQRNPAKFKLMHRRHSKQPVGEQGFYIDQCLIWSRFCIAVADAWLTSIRSSQLIDTDDLDVESALKAAKSLARLALSQSDLLNFQNCLCRRLVILQSVRTTAKSKRLPKVISDAAADEAQQPESRSTVRCDVKSICDRVNGLSFGLNQRSSQWFCNQAFIIQEPPSWNGIPVDMQSTPPYCPCILFTRLEPRCDYIKPGSKLLSKCLTIDNLRDSMKAMSIRPIHQPPITTMTTVELPVESQDFDPSGLLAPSELQAEVQSLRTGSLDGLRRGRFATNTDRAQASTSTADATLQQEAAAAAGTLQSIFFQAVQPVPVASLSSFDQASDRIQSSFGDLGMLASQIARQNDHGRQTLTTLQRSEYPADSMRGEVSLTLDEAAGFQYRTEDFSSVVMGRSQGHRYTCEPLVHAYAECSHASEPVDDDAESLVRKRKRKPALEDMRLVESPPDRTLVELGFAQDFFSYDEQPNLQQIWGEPDAGLVGIAEPEPIRESLGSLRSDQDPHTQDPERGSEQRAEFSNYPVFY